MTMRTKPNGGRNGERERRATAAGANTSGVRTTTTTMMRAGLVALVCALAAAHIAGTDAAGRAATTWTISHAPRVLPGHALAISLSFQGDLTDLPAVLPFVGAGAFLSADLVLTAPGLYAANAVSPAVEGEIGVQTLAWTVPGRPDIDAISSVVLNECSDGVYCNGPEYFVRGECVKGRDPCDDPEPGPAKERCTSCVCDERFGNVTFRLTGAHSKCVECNEIGNCQPSCKGRTCGSDGCSGACPPGCAPGLFCVAGACLAADYPGACSQPIPLVPADASPYGGVIEVYGDTSAPFLVDTHRPSCNPDSAAANVFYSVTLPEASGFEIRVQAASGNPDSLDSVIELRAADAVCSPLGLATPTCSDDATPPGGVGSALRGVLQAGTHLIMIDGFSASAVGPFVMTAAFFAGGAVPNCDGRFCGPSGAFFPNGTQYDCFPGPAGFEGDCAAVGRVCVNGRCVPSGACQPDCSGRGCGPDGCGGSCGSCSVGLTCVETTGKCRSFAVCDHLLPACKNKCGAKQYCGSDCACHDVDAPMIDLTLSYDDVINSLRIELHDVSPSSCTLSPDEGPCVGGSGVRRLLRFTTSAENIGFGSFKPGVPEDRPDLFVFSACHNHWHFKDFAVFRLLDAQGRIVRDGGKRAYCMEDSHRLLSAPWVPCTPHSTCEDQGIQQGWSDVYPAELECQWIDITGLPAGDYVLRMSVNLGRIFAETSWDNQGHDVAIEIPPPLPTRSVQTPRLIAHLGKVSF